VHRHSTQFFKMAEAFGLAANTVGVASFSIQLADSILKLKEFVDKVKEAPETIRYLIVELEMLNSVLIELQNNDEEAKQLGGRIFSSEAVSRSLFSRLEYAEYCAEGNTAKNRKPE
jgi:hypothetical protein